MRPDSSHSPHPRLAASSRRDHGVLTNHALLRRHSLRRRGRQIRARQACPLRPRRRSYRRGFVAKQAGFADIITYDMGGTSTDVATVLDGRPQWTTSSTVDGLPIGAADVRIHTVGAGGGRSPNSMPAARCASAPARRRGARSGLLRARRNRADGDGREPGAWPHPSRSISRRRRCASTMDLLGQRSSRSPRDGQDDHGSGGGNHPRRRGEHGARDRADHQPPRARPAAIHAR